MRQRYRLAQQLYRQGLPLEAVAHRLRASFTTVLKAVRAGGIPLRRPVRRRLSPARIAQAAALRQAGVPYRAIASRLGCTSGAVLYMLQLDAPPLDFRCAHCGGCATARHHVCYHPVPVVVSVCAACHSRCHARERAAGRFTIQSEFNAKAPGGKDAKGGEEGGWVGRGFNAETQGGGAATKSSSSSFLSS